MLIIFVSRSSEEWLVGILFVIDGMVYAIAAAWVRRDVDVLALNMRTQEGGEGGEGEEDLLLWSMASLFLFRIKSERKPWPKWNNND